jgi:hypothetical protein
MPCSPKSHPTFRTNIYPPSSGSKSKASMKQATLLGLFLDPEIVATCSSETSVDFQRTTRHYTQEDRIFHSHHCENLRHNQETFHTCHTIFVGPDAFLVQESGPKTHAEKNESKICIHVPGTSRYFKMASVWRVSWGLNCTGTFIRKLV